MAKRNRRANGGREEKARRDSFVEDVPLAEAARTRYLNYALSVITSRALPDVRDGLKPVQRRILYAMWSDLHVTADSRYMKSAAVVGEVMKTYHPARRPVDLRRPGADGPAVQPPPPAGRGLRQLRLDRWRPARRDAVHRVPSDRRSPRTCSASSASRPSTSGRTTPSTDRGAGGPPGAVPQPAGQRGVGHRRGHGDEHPAAQPQRGVQGPGALLEARLDNRELPLEKTD